MVPLDRIHRFVFENTGIRGEVVQLHASWQAVLKGQNYPGAVSAQLGQAVAAVVLLGITIKFKGSLILQAQGHGPLRTLVAQASDARTIRGLARWSGAVERGNLAQTFGPGRLVLTVTMENGEPYQGIVALEGRDLAEALETYFARSEQLRTRLWLVADEKSARGLLLQELPSHSHRPGDWERLNRQGAAFSTEDACTATVPGLLCRLFPEECVRLFASQPVSFRCRCSRARLEKALIALGREELDAILDELGTVDASCDFCRRGYEFDRVDIAGLFHDSVRAPSSSTRQ